MSVVTTHAGRQILPARRPLWLKPPFIAVFGAMSFNFALCFVNTSVGGVGNSAIIGCEVAIISGVLLFTYPALDYSRLLVIGGALLYLVGLSAVRVLLGDAFDVKPVRDFLIPIAFFLLGTRAPDVKAADTIVRVATLIVVAVGLVEYLFPDLFTRFFNIASFYIERGSMEATQAQQSSHLFVSGMRPAGATGGRNLLPFLGDHRISSIFLEPVSAGNFGIVVFMWALVRSIAERKLFWGLFAAALLIVVMADSRFGAYFCVICLLFALWPASIRSMTTALLPVLCLLGLIVLPGLVPATYSIDGGLVGRVIVSGQLLGQFDLLNWLALRAPSFITSDSGYAYAIGGVGIVGLAIFWMMFLSVKSHSRSFDLFRSLVGAYLTFLLCISNSSFTIKTASLLWFLTGVLSCGEFISWRRRPRTPAAVTPPRTYH
jgi:putative polymerase